MDWTRSPSFAFPLGLNISLDSQWRAGGGVFARLPPGSGLVALHGVLGIMAQGSILGFGLGLPLSLRPSPLLLPTNPPRKCQGRSQGEVRASLPLPGL